jgi:RNA polymerase sigma-70 factor (ECF subfamily)
VRAANQLGQYDSRMNTLQKALIVAGFCQLLTAPLYAQDIDSTPPVVVKAEPEAGSKEVVPGVVEIRVTFSKPMTDQSWSWSSAWKDSVPETVGKPRYEADQKTCVLKVKLEPNKTYGYWINSEKFRGFQDQQGHSAVPYLLVFKTKDH